MHRNQDYKHGPHSGRPSADDAYDCGTKGEAVESRSDGLIGKARNGAATIDDEKTDLL